MQWFLDNRDYITELTLQHLWLSVVPVIIALILSIPLGWLAFQHPRLRAWILGAGTVVYAIPSLALFVLLPSIFRTGYLSPINVMIALGFYALALLVRSVLDGFTSVSKDVLLAAQSIGYSQREIVLRVHLPLAGPVIIAGTRVAMVSSVSLVSVGAIIGVNSLGSLFTNGFQRGFATPIFVGIIGTVVLAFALEALVALCARFAMPWSRA